MKFRAQRRLAIGFLVFYISFYYVWIASFQGNDQWLMIGANSLHLVAPILASVFLFLPVMKVKDKTNLYWLLLFLGCVSYLVGQLIWNYYENILGEQRPFPGTTDIFFLLQAILFLLAILYKLKLDFSRSQSIKYYLDVIAMIIIILFFSIEYLIHPQSMSISWLEYLFLLSYPALAIGILIGLLLLNYYTDFNEHLKVLILGVFILVFSEISYSFMLFQESYQTGSLVDPMFSLGLYIVGLSAFSYKTFTISGNEKVVKQNYTRFFFPLIIIVILVILFLFHSTRANEHVLDFVDVGIIITVFIMVVRIIVTSLENETLYKRKIEELNLAKNVQEELLPSPIRDSSISTSSYFKASEELSGDLYYWYKINEKQYGILILDVMGHGVSSSIISLSIRALMHGLTTKVVEPKVVMAELSNHLNRMFDQKSNPYYFTAIYLVIDTEKKKVTYVNAGHPSALWKEMGKEVIKLESTCPPIGMFDDSPIYEEEITYENSGRFVLYTDGFLESYAGIQSNQVLHLEGFLREHEQIELIDFKDKLLMKCTYNTEDDKCLVVVDVKK